jgi:putative hydrolase of the HAD superfamily
LIAAVLFDLDDTLFLQAEWLSGAWSAVAATAQAEGLDSAALLDALVAIAAEGSDRGRIIDRALAAVGAEGIDVAPLLASFRAHAPETLPLLPGVRDGLDELRRQVPIGLVSDGDPSIQGAKLRALGLADAFDVVVLSDELGRELRKPHPAPFLAALEALGVEPGTAVFVGDRPAKDVAGAIAVGMRAIRVQGGEHTASPDLPGTWRTVAHVGAAIEVLLAELGGTAAPLPQTEMA